MKFEFEVEDGVEGVVSLDLNLRAKVRVTVATFVIDFY